MQGDETAQDLHRSIIKSASNSEGEWLFVSTQSIKCSICGRQHSTLGPTDISVHRKPSCNDKHSDHQGNMWKKVIIGMCPLHSVCYYCYAVDIYGTWSHDLVGLAQKGIQNTAGPSERSFSHRSSTLGDKGQSKTCLKMTPFNLASIKNLIQNWTNTFYKTTIHVKCMCTYITHTRAAA